MRVCQTLCFEILRNGHRYRVFPAKQTAVAYLAAAMDLDPGSDWSIRELFCSKGGASDE